MRVIARWSFWLFSVLVLFLNVYTYNLTRVHITTTMKCYYYFACVWPIFTTTLLCYSTSYYYNYNDYVLLLKI